MSGRSRSLGGSCIMVRRIGCLSELSSLTRSYVVPFLIMGRVTYVHHYVSPFSSYPDPQTLSIAVRFIIASDPLFLGFDVRTSPGSLRFHRQTTDGEDEVDNILRLCHLSRGDVLVVQRVCFRYRRSHQRPMGSQMA